MIRKLWMDDAGVVSIEYLLLSVVVGLGMAVGVSALSDSLNAEYVELGQSILCLDDGYLVNFQGSFGTAPTWVGVKQGTFVTDASGFVGYTHVGPAGVSVGSFGIAGATP